MQTFLPYPDFAKSARVLDMKRLGKQRSEVLQILNALTHKGGWSNHPAVRMWRGHRLALIMYGIAICNEWRARGYRDNTRKRLKLRARHIPMSEVDNPRWVGNRRFHASHRANLKRKDPVHYAQFIEDPSLPYVWPNES